MEALPEELKSHIISYLDKEPPSSSWFQHEPGLYLADSDLTPLKNLSLVSKGWRRLVKSPLFRCIRMKLVSWEDMAFTSLAVPSTSKFRWAAKARREEFKHRLFRGVGYPRDIEWAYRHAWQDTAPERAANWLNTLDTNLSQLLFLLAEHELLQSVETLSITVDGELDQGRPDYVREEIHSLNATATFWDILFRSMDPAKVTIVAPPSTLACLLSCSIRMLDSWAFPGMNYQLVTLTRPSDSRRITTTTKKLTGYNRSESVHLRMGPNDPARPALASLLYIRPWSHLYINEGSYLQAYSTYEYFHKEPPGIIYPLAQGFEVPMAQESLTYHAVFPFHDYLAAAVNLMSTGILQNLNVKLVPSAEDKTWDSPERIGKADISDCWGEIEQVYSLMFNAPTPEDGHLAAHSNVTRFTSGDCAIESLRSMLERAFGVLEWEQSERGVWTITEEAASKRRILQGIEYE